MATLRQAETDVWDYTPATAKSAGDVVLLGKVVGVVCRPIAANAKGAVAVRGVFNFPKAGGGALVAGQVAYLDGAGNVTGSLTASGIAGLVAEPAASADTSCVVSINHGCLYDVNATGP